MQLHDFVPPILSRLRSRLRSSKSGSGAPTTYRTYAEALTACDGKGYEDQELTRVVFEKTRAYRDALARRPELKVSSTEAYGLLSLAYCLAPGDGRRALSVIDFGGACGAHYFTFRKFFAGAVGLNWIVVETKGMCDVAAPLATSELRFSPDLDEALRLAGTVDLLHASGTIQFVAEPYAILRRINASGANHLLFNRLALGPGSEDVITVHRSMLSWNGIGPLPAAVPDREVAYPYTLLSRPRFEASLAGYDPVVEFDDRSGAPFADGGDVSNVGRLYRLRSAPGAAGEPK
jgi:putative methyltransferase (TIGR04325 family)